MSKSERQNKPYSIRDTLNLDARNPDHYRAAVEALSAPNTGGFINIYYGPHAGMTEVWLHGSRDSIVSSSAEANARLDELEIRYGYRQS